MVAAVEGGDGLLEALPDQLRIRVREPQAGPIGDDDVGEAGAFAEVLCQRLELVLRVARGHGLPDLGEGRHHVGCGPRPLLVLTVEGLPGQPPVEDRPDGGRDDEDADDAEKHLGRQCPKPPHRDRLPPVRLEYDAAAAWFPLPGAVRRAQRT